MPSQWRIIGRVRLVKLKMSLEKSITAVGGVQKEPDQGDQCSLEEGVPFQP